MGANIGRSGLEQPDQRGHGGGRIGPLGLKRHEGLDLRGGVGGLQGRNQISDRPLGGGALSGTTHYPHH